MCYIKTSSWYAMIYSMISWLMFVVESLAIDLSVQALLQQSGLLGCGTCAICSTSYSNCAPGNIGFDQDNSLTSFCTQSTSSTQFWGCLCTQASTNTLVSAAVTSLANCPANYPNSTLSSVLTEFSSICVALGFSAPAFSSGATTPSVAPTSTQTSTNCSIPANSDLLGIGVRVYLQCFANLITALARPDEAETSALLSQILMTGILIATVFSVSQNQLPPSETVTALWFTGIDFSLL
jgi:hypothetical protein